MHSCWVLQQVTHATTTGLLQRILKFSDYYNIRNYGISEINIPKITKINMEDFTELVALKVIIKHTTSLHVYTIFCTNLILTL